MQPSPNYIAPTASDSLAGIIRKKLFARHDIADWKYWATLAVLAATLNIGIMGLPPFRFGMWFQSEPIFFALLVTSGFAALMLAFWWRSDVAIFAPLKHRAMQIFSLFLLWALIVSLFCNIPMQSLFGPSEISEGWLYFLSIWMHTLLVCRLLSHAYFARALMFLLAFSLLFTTCLQELLSQDDKIFKWGDYLGFLGIFYFASLPAFFTQFRHAKLKCAMVLIGVISVTVSNNYSAIALMLAFGACGLMGYALRNTRFVRLYTRFIIVLAFSVPLLWSAIAWNNQTTQSAGHAIVNMLTFVEKQLPADSRLTRFIKTYQVALNPDNGAAFYNGSFGVRMLINRAGYDFLRDKPIVTLLGDGFGGFNDILYRYAVTDGVTLYDQKDYANWNIVTGHAFHPHNEWMYMLTSAGIVGLLLWLAFLISLLRVRPEFAYSVIPAWLAYQCLSTVWFIVPIVTGFFAIAIACSVQCSALRVRPIPVKLPRATILMAPIVGILFFIGACMQYIAANEGQRMITRIQQSLPSNEVKPIRDFGMGGLRQWWVATLMQNYLNDKPLTNTPYKESDVAWLRANLFLMHQVAQRETKIMRVDAYRLNVTNDVMQYYQKLDGIWQHTANELRAAWKDEAMKFALKEPTRLDLLTPYFEYWLNQYAEAKTEEEKAAAIDAARSLATELLKTYPQNPILRWYYGKTLMTNPKTEARGIAMAIDAYRDGVAYKVPITNTLKAFMDSKINAPAP